MRAEDIEALVSVGRPSLGPAGAFAVFATSRPDIAADRAVGQLWRVDLPGGAPRRLTRGTADAAPLVSPDGTRIAFVRGDARGRGQVFVVDAAGGEPVQATDAPLGVGEVAWSPDGAMLAYTARVPEEGRYGAVEGLLPSAEAPRRITGIRWQENGLGYTDDRPSHVFVVEAPDPGDEPLYAPAPAVGESDRPRLLRHDPVRLTPDGMTFARVVFTPDGAEVLSLVEEIPAQRPDLRARVVAVRVDGGGVREVLGQDRDLAVVDLAVAEDGALALLAHDLGPEGTDIVAPIVGLWLLRDGDLRELTDPDAHDLGEIGSRIGVLGDDFLVQDRARGRVGLLRVSRDGGVSEVLAGDVEVVGHGGAGERIVASVATPTSFGELVTVEEGAVVTVTDFGAAAREAGIVLPQETTIVARDGYPVHGWVARPEGDGPHPVLLQIHGGPYASYGIHLFDGTQVLVDAGYAVVYCNPRGSAGYGRAHGRAIRHAMGTVDFTDVMDFLDGVIAADPALDSTRTGVMGGSYGGYLTAWIIAHDHRFAGAVVERGFLDPISFAGTSDIGSFFGDEYVGTDPGAIARQSPMEVVGQVTTPTLVVHSEQDLRCPLEQATRYYTALRRGGVEAELLIFPGEDHELTRGGRPRHRVERFAAVADWWRRRLPVG